MVVVLLVITSVVVAVEFLVLRTDRN
jgi:hypothetical protein